MKHKKYRTMPLIVALLVFACLAVPAILFSQAREIGYRAFMLGYDMGRVRDIIRADFGDYKLNEEGRDRLVLTRSVLDKPVVMIVLIYDQGNTLYKINVKMRKIPENPTSDEVMAVIEDKYGPPSKKTISNSLDLTAYWYFDDRRYEIFFQSVSSWDKFEVQYTDSFLQQRKEKHDKEMNRKPANKELDF
jgi:hypothetical protein